MYSRICRCRSLSSPRILRPLSSHGERSHYSTPLCPLQTQVRKKVDAGPGHVVNFGRRTNIRGADIGQGRGEASCSAARDGPGREPHTGEAAGAPDRKSTRLNSSHVKISYAVFCLKKK